MRVAIFTDTYHQINGVAMVYNRFARWCADKGYDVEIFTPGDGDFDEFGTVRVHNIGMFVPIPYYRDLSYDVTDAFFIRRKIVRYMAERGFDLVHIATQGHMGVAALRVAAKLGLPKISCYHTAIPEYAYDRFFKLGDNPLGRSIAKAAYELCWWYQRKLFRSSSLILVPTQSIKEMVEEEIGVPSAFFTRGVDSTAFSPENGNKPNGHNPKTLYAGRISVEKNLQLLEKLDQSEGENMVFVGDGPYTTTLRRNLPRAHFTGFLHGNALQEAYASADIFVFPSKTDTFGNAVLEAMASGLPVVVTNVLGPKDFVRHGETGFIAENDEEFVHYHRMLLEDDDLRKRMSAQARAYALTRSWDTIFETELIDNYRRVIEEARR